MILIKELFQEDFESCFEFDSKTINLWSKKQWKSEFKKNGIKVIALFVEKEIIGICVFHVVIDEAQINYFSIHQNFRREGYGSHLMIFSIERCRHLDLKKLSLEVSAENIAANEFYKCFNFLTVGQRKNYYRNGVDAVLKEKFL